MEFVVDGQLDLDAIEVATDTEFAGMIRRDIEWYAGAYGAKPEGIRINPNYDNTGIKVECTFQGVYYAYTTYVYKGRRHNHKDSIALNCVESYIEFVREKQAQPQQPKKKRSSRKQV